MAKSSKRLLEWQFASIVTANATPLNGRIALGLRDDEIAEIHKIMTEIIPEDYPVGGTDDNIDLALALSMDPDVVKDPINRANQADLEWFYTHRLETQIELTTSGAYFGKNNDSKSEDFDPPIIVGTDVGMVVTGDFVVGIHFWVRAYFTRRKATIAELNQVLLKRR